MFQQKAQAVHQARVQEDDVWQKSQVDPVVKQLEAADKQQDAYMTAFRYITIAVGTGTWGIAAVIPKYLSLRLWLSVTM